MDNDITIDLNDIATTITIDSSTMNSIGTTSGFNGTSGAYLTANTASGTSWISNNTHPWSITNGGITSNPSPGLKVTGDAEFEGAVMINGRNISEFMETISKRLAILVPDPAKLEHFAALKKAYEQYKTLEALCEVPKKDSDE